jgi:N-acyl-D-aspartate/D-glutamate deacylase
MERAVQLMTSEPAKLFGLRDRGRLAVGAFADLVVFDPETVGASKARLVEDLPGDTGRLFADSTGVVRVLVNGVETVADDQPTGARPGSLRRWGRGTDTVATS